jgi:hypothetical protein
LKFEIKQGPKFIRTFYSIDYLREYLEKENAVVVLHENITWSEVLNIQTLLGEIRYPKSRKPSEFLYVNDPVIKRMRQPLALVITGFNFSEVA